MSEIATQLAGSALLLVGGAVIVIGAAGVLRLPDVYTRLHSAGVSDTLGAGLVVAGLMFYAGWSLVAVKLLLIWLFLFFTSPVASHALARAALAGDVAPRLSEHPDD